MTRTHDIEVNDGETITPYRVTHSLDIEGLHIIAVQDSEGNPVEYDPHLWRMVRSEVAATYGMGEDDLGYGLEDGEW